MNTNLFKGISVVLHPLFLPTISALLIFQMPVYPFSFYTPYATWIVIALTAVFTIFIPVFLIFLLKRSGFIQSYHMEEKKDRILPLFVVGLMMYLVVFVCRKWQLPVFWNIVMLLSAMQVILTLGVSLFKKISIHLVGWGSLSGLIIYLIYAFEVNYFIWLSLAILLSGLAAAARAALNAHKAGELIFGFVIGIVTMTGGLFLLI